MNRRSLLQIIGSFSGLLVYPWQPVRAEVDSGQNIFEYNTIDEILHNLFNTTVVLEDHSIKVEAPREAENKALVPYRVFAPGADRLLIFVKNNDRPLAAMMEFHSPALPGMMGTVSLQRSSSIFVVAVREDKLFFNAISVRIAESGFEIS